MRVRMRTSSSPAALRVKVSPSTWLGCTCPFASSQSTRSAIVSVLPLPAPATTRAGASGASITAACCGVGGNIDSRCAISTALTRSVTAPLRDPGEHGAEGRPAVPHLGLDEPLEPGRRHALGGLHEPPAHRVRGRLLEGGLLDERVAALRRAADVEQARP